MTDPEMADVTYIEPITWQVVERSSRRSARRVLPTMGGQTALNCALDLAARRAGQVRRRADRRQGSHRQGRGPPEVQGCDDQDRSGFRPLRHRPQHGRGASGAGEIGFPTIIRPSFTLGGTGGGIAYNREEFEEICKRGLEPRRPTSC
jgi:carbamoyl-phosphate synthase large subunit